MASSQCHGLPVFLHEQFLQPRRPLALHRQQMGILMLIVCTTTLTSTDHHHLSNQLGPPFSPLSPSIVMNNVYPKTGTINTTVCCMWAEASCSRHGFHALVPSRRLPEFEAACDEKKKTRLLKSPSSSPRTTIKKKKKNATESWAPYPLLCGCGAVSSRHNVVWSCCHGRWHCGTRSCNHSRCHVMPDCGNYLVALSRATYWPPRRPTWL